MKRITQKDLKLYLRYHKTTGNFIWRKRTPEMFNNGQKNSKEQNCNIWNARFAGKVAGCKDLDGYILISINRIKYKAHRLAFLYVTGELPKNDIDHLNQITFDNSWKNLRNATRTFNNANMKKRKDNSSGYKGISWSKLREKWEVYGNINKQRKRIGMFVKLNEAIKARKKWAQENFGEYLNVNSP